MMGLGEDENVVINPKKIEGLEGEVEIIACGQSFSVIKTNKKLYGFGNSEQGQLTWKESESSPKEIEFEEKEKVRKISCGKFHTLMLLDDGRVFSFGETKRGGISEIKFPSPITSIDAGWMHSLAVAENGEIYSWGSGMYHQLGTGKQFDIKKPILIEALKGEKIKGVSGGLFHSGAINEKGEVFTWGLVSSVGNQLGHPKSKGMPLPKKITQYINNGGETPSFKNIFCSLHHTLFLTDNGLVYSCGSNVDHALGYELESEDKNSKKFNQIQEIPKLINGLQNVRDCAVGPSHNYALLNDGNVVFWGQGNDHQFASEDRGMVVLPSLIPSITNVSKISTGWSHTLFI